MSTALQRILFQNAPADLQLDKVQRKPKNALKQLSPRQCEHADHPWIASPGWKEFHPCELPEAGQAQPEQLFEPIGRCRFEREAHAVQSFRFGSNLDPIAAENVRNQRT